MAVAKLALVCGDRVVAFAVVLQAGDGLLCPCTVRSLLVSALLVTMWLVGVGVKACTLRLAPVRLCAGRTRRHTSFATSRAQKVQTVHSEVRGGVCIHRRLRVLIEITVRSGAIGGTGRRPAIMSAHGWAAKPSRHPWRGAMLVKAELSSQTATAQRSFGT